MTNNNNHHTYLAKVSSGGPLEASEASCSLTVRRSCCSLDSTTSSLDCTIRILITMITKASQCSKSSDVSCALLNHLSVKIIYTVIK